MDNSYKVKDIRKKLLDHERNRKVKVAQEDVLKRYSGNLSGEFYSVTGPIIEEYELRKELIDEGIIDPSLLTSVPNITQPSKPQLFNTHKSRYRYHSKLEKLFTKVPYSAYEDIGVTIGIIKKKSQYRHATKKQILGIKDIFNNKSIKLWKERLKATRNKTSDGLKLVPC